jgi:hypothetical protein
MFLGPLSISVLGPSQLNQGYSVPTMHQLVKDNKVRFLCLRPFAKWTVGIDLPLGACSLSKSQYSPTLLLPTMAEFRQPAMGFRTESCFQVNLPWSNMCLHWTRTWNSVCLAMFPHSWQLTEACLYHLLRSVKVDLSPSCYSQQISRHHKEGLYSQSVVEQRDFLVQYTHGCKQPMPHHPPLASWVPNPPRSYTV